ncbi:MAG: hypothetical protein ACXAC6_17690 [Candidatus Hodarchaeales archaeon]
MSVVTIARMIKLEKKKDLSLPLVFIEYLKSEDREKGWAIMILDSSTQIVRIIPTKSPCVIRVSIDYIKTKTLCDIPQEQGIIFMRNSIKTLYSSAICYAESHKTPCRPIEHYIDLSDLSISNDQLKSELLAIHGIVNVKITNLDVNNGDFG